MHHHKAPFQAEAPEAIERRITGVNLMTTDPSSGRNFSFFLSSVTASSGIP
jgi:hypothetical protein